MFKKIFIIIFVCLSLFSFLEYSPAAAAPAATAVRDSGTPPTQFPNPLKTTSVPELIGRVISAVLGVVGSIALIMFVYGGLIWMTAAGNQERVKKGGDILMWAAIGLVIIFSAYAIVYYVIDKMLV